MARTAVTSRTAVASRDPLVPQSYNANIYGDSLYDYLGGQGSIGQVIEAFTSQLATPLELATGGNNFSQIRATFDANFPPTDAAINTIIIGGIHNDLGADTALSSIQSDVSHMLDTVIADGRFNLIMINGTQYGDNTNWTQARQNVLDAYNTWLSANYSAYVIGAYSILANSSDATKLATEFYKTTTDSHPNDNADRAVDGVISELLYQRSNADLTEPAGNVLGNYRDLSGWTLGNAAVGGNSVTLADGTTSSSVGLISDSTASAIKQAQKGVTAGAIADSTTIEVKGYVRAGLRRWALVRYTDNAGNTYQIPVDLWDVALDFANEGGTGAASTSWAITKYNGFVEVTLQVDSGIGGGANNVLIRAQESNTVVATVGDARSPEIFIDAVSLREA